MFTGRVTAATLACALTLGVGCAREGIDFGGGSATPTATPVGDFQRRRALTLDNSGFGGMGQGSTDLVDFPMLVALDPTRIDYAVMQANGEDLRFYTPDGVELAYEIEEWNNANGESCVWVKVPFVPAASTTDFIWMYYGDLALGEAEDSAAVWSNGYVAVWHLAEQVTDGDSNGTHFDSTENGNDGAQRSNGPASLAGSIGPAQEFDGSDDYIEIDQTGLQLAGDQITIEARVYARFSNLALRHVYGAGGSGTEWVLLWDANPDDWLSGFGINGQLELVQSSQGHQLDEWASLATRYDGDDLDLLVDGTLRDRRNMGGNLELLDGALWLGLNPVIGNRDWDGFIDEVRVSHVARSGHWLRLQQRVFDDAFVTFGPEESL